MRHCSGTDWAEGIKEFLKEEVKKGSIACKEWDKYPLQTVLSIM